MKILESPPAFVTSGVADWLTRLVDLNPDLAPPRTDPTAEDPGAADWLRRFVREVVTVNPVTRDALSSMGAIPKCGHVALLFRLLLS